MNIRIQTYGMCQHLSDPVGRTRRRTGQAKINGPIANGNSVGTTAFEALEKGLDDLMDVCDVVTDKFTEAKANFGGKA